MQVPTLLLATETQVANQTPAVQSGISGDRPPDEGMFSLSISEESQTQNSDVTGRQASAQQMMEPTEVVILPQNATVMPLDTSAAQNPSKNVEASPAYPNNSTDAQSLALISEATLSTSPAVTSLPTEVTEKKALKALRDESAEQQRVPPIQGAVQITASTAAPLKTVAGDQQEVEIPKRQGANQRALTHAMDLPPQQSEQTGNLDRKNKQNIPQPNTIAPQSISHGQERTAASIFEAGISESANPNSEAADAGVKLPPNSPPAQTLATPQASAAPAVVPTKAMGTPDAPSPQETHVKKTNQLVETVIKTEPKNSSTRQVTSPVPSTPIEIAFQPAEARPQTSEKHKIVLGSVQASTLEMEVESSAQTEITVNALRKRKEVEPWQDKTPLPPLRNFSAVNVEKQAHLLAGTTQNVQFARASGPNPAFLRAPNTLALESSTLTEATQSRDGSLHSFGAASEVRKERISPLKIDTFARPIIQQLTQTTKNLGSGAIEIKLAPEELGRVRLSLNPGETNMSVHISAERPETADLIRRNIELFSQSLRQEGFTNLSFSFGDQKGSHTGAQDDDTQTVFLDEASAPDAPTTARPPTRNQISGHLDIRL